MKVEFERTGRSRRPRLTFAALAALSLAPAGALAADNGPLGYPCGRMPGKLPQDNTGVLAGLPQATLAGYLDYPITIKKSPYENFKPKHGAPWKVIHIGNFVGNDWHVIQIAQFEKTADAMKKAGLISEFSQVHADASVPVQIQQMRTAIQQGYDAIVLEPNSESALNAVIDQAFKAGIVVVIQDSPADSINAINVGGNAVQYGGTKAELLADNLGGKGNVLMVSGLPGNPDNALFEKGAHSVLDRYCPGIKVVQDPGGRLGPGAGQVDDASNISRPVHRGRDRRRRLAGFLGHGDPRHPGVPDRRRSGALGRQRQPRQGLPRILEHQQGQGLPRRRQRLAVGERGGTRRCEWRSRCFRVKEEGLKVSDIPAQIPTVTANDLSSWVDASWTPDTPGMTDQTVGKYLSDEILAPLFNKPAPTIP